MHQNVMSNSSKSFLLWFTRALSAALAGLFGWYGVWSTLGLLRNGVDAFVIIPLFTFTVTAILATYAILGGCQGVRRYLGSVLLAGLAVGSLSFLAGFIGPMIFSSSNQGPLLGIFFTGPLGFVIGCVGGAAWTWSRSRPTAPIRPVRTGGGLGRSLLAIVVGLVVSSALGSAIDVVILMMLPQATAQDFTLYARVMRQPAIFAVVLTWKAGAASLAGYLAALIAGRAAEVHGLVLAGLQVGVGGLALATNRGGDRVQIWSTVVMILVTGAATYCGARLQKRFAHVA